MVSLPMFQIWHLWTYRAAAAVTFTWIAGNLPKKHNVVLVPCIDSDQVQVHLLLPDWAVDHVSHGC